jgi:hypothetical protein
MVARGAKPHNSRALQGALMMRVSLAAACMLATADAQGHNHPGGRP